MVTAYDVDQQRLVERASQELNLEAPDWSKLVKTGTSRERPPEQENWWQMRAASVLRRIYMDGPVGVERLRSAYGGSKNLGHQPSHFRKASGKVIRKILQDLEEKGYVKKEKKGRAVTPKGQKFLDSVAHKLSG